MSQNDRDGNAPLRCRLLGHKFNPLSPDNSRRAGSMFIVEYECRRCGEVITRER